MSRFSQVIRNLRKEVAILGFAGHGSATLDDLVFSGVPVFLVANNDDSGGDSRENYKILSSDGFFKGEFAQNNLPFCQNPNNNGFSVFPLGDIKAIFSRWFPRIFKSGQQPVSSENIAEFMSLYEGTKSHRISDLTGSIRKMHKLVNLEDLFKINGQKWFEIEEFDKFAVEYYRQAQRLFSERKLEAAKRIEGTPTIKEFHEYFQPKLGNLIFQFLMMRSTDHTDFQAKLKACGLVPKNVEIQFLTPYRLMLACDYMHDQLGRQTMLEEGRIDNPKILDKPFILNSIRYLKPDGQQLRVEDISPEIRGRIQQASVRVFSAGSKTNLLPLVLLFKNEVKNGFNLAVENMFNSINEHDEPEFVDFHFRDLGLLMISLMAGKDAFSITNGDYAKYAQAYEDEHKRQVILDDVEHKFSEIDAHIGAGLGLSIESLLLPVLNISKKGIGKGIKYDPLEIGIYAAKIIETLWNEIIPTIEAETDEDVESDSQLSLERQFTIEVLRRFTKPEHNGISKLDRIKNEARAEYEKQLHLESIENLELTPRNEIAYQDFIKKLFPKTPLLPVR